MATNRVDLSILNEQPFITDGGLETDLIFNRGFDLPEFASFVLVCREDGRTALVDYFEQYLALAKRHGVGCVLESPTWRASQDWGTRLGLSADDLKQANRDAIALLEELRSKWQSDTLPIVISGCIGPRGDGYTVDLAMSADEAQRYHATQIETLADTTADLVSAFTINYANEAIGIVRAARQAEIPIVISFTVETDGRLPSGQPLAEAIQETDDQPEGRPLHYMVNCAHPTHFMSELDPNATWTGRLRGIRANASAKSHAELDEMENLDIGDIDELARLYSNLGKRLTHLGVFGGCCGTDHRHLTAICESLFANS